jgi:hypothetical protein
MSTQACSTRSTHQPVSHQPCQSLCLLLLNGGPLTPSQRPAMICCKCMLQRNHVLPCPRKGMVAVCSNDSHCYWCQVKCIVTH